MDQIRVGVVDEHDVFRRGVVVCLAEDPLLRVVADVSHGPLTEEVHVVVTSARAASQERFACPVLVFSGGEQASRHRHAPNNVVGLLPRSTLTPERLIGAVHAAAAGFRIDVPTAAPAAVPRFDERRLQVLRLLAQGAATREIAESLRYSERTVKSLIQEVERELGARSRAQAVAEGIRQGFI